MLHILVIPSWYPQSEKDITGSFFREQILALHSINRSIGVIAPDLCSPVKEIAKVRKRLLGKSISFENDKGVPTYRYNGISWFPKIPYANYFLWVRAGLKLFKEYVKHHGKPDVIHCHSYLYGGIIANKVFKKYGIRFLVTEHSSDYLKDTFPFWKLRLVKKAVLNGNTLTVGPHLKEALRNRLNLTNYKIGIHPNMVDERFLAAPLRKPKTSVFSFINIGKFDSNKGQELLIKAFKEYNINKDSVLKIIGDGRLQNRLRQLIKELNLEDSVFLIGTRDREGMVSEISDAHALVISSVHETFGVVAIEALALGKPVLTTACGGPEAIIENSSFGIVAKTNDINDLKEGMIKIKEVYNRFDPAEIRNHCQENYSAKALSEKFLGILMDIERSTDN